MFIVQEVTQGAMALHCLGREAPSKEARNWKSFEAR